MCEEYNGWANRITWSVSLWLNNDHGLYLNILETAEVLKRNAPSARQVNENIWTEEQYTRYKLADYIESYVKECNPLVSDASMYSDILGWAIAGCDWQSVASSFLEE